jgi:hypothetical protein
VVVRSLINGKEPAQRICPKELIKIDNIACNDHDAEQFLEIVQDQGVFAISKYEAEGSVKYIV